MNYKQTADEIVLWLRNYATDNNLKSFVVGVSGGVDSALVSTLCALTGLRTYVVSMPINQSPDQLARAHDHCNWLTDRFLNVGFQEIDLTVVYTTFENALSSPLSFTSKLGFANSKSRLRMVTLYQIASSSQGLVVGTGNKIEDFGVGFYTKYGDGGVDISPIAGLTKTQVRAMAKELGILEQLVTAVPTDGLWEDNRSDEDQIGASYEELEWAMEFFGSHDPKFVEKLTPRQLQVIDIYRKFNTQNKHKMLPIPTFIPKQ